MAIDWRSAVGKSFELYDINQRVTMSKLRHKVASNIEFVLRREKLLPEGHSVIIPVGGDIIGELDSDGIRNYEANFEIFGPDMNTIVAYGTVYGDTHSGYLGEITVEITEATGDIPKPRFDYSVTAKKSGKKRNRGSNAGLSSTR